MAGPRLLDTEMTITHAAPCSPGRRFYIPEGAGRVLGMAGGGPGPGGAPRLDERPEFLQISEQDDGRVVVGLQLACSDATRRLALLSFSSLHLGWPAPALSYTQQPFRRAVQMLPHS